MGDPGDKGERTRPPWAQVEPLFHGALEQPAAQREAWLKRRCGEDRALYQEVRSLLRAAETESSPLDSGVRVNQAQQAEDQTTRGPAAGDRVGAYLLVREIGQGGMGQVFLAERADGQFQQHVAIKFLKPAAREHLARFQTERQILAGLSHPGIARLLDGGISPDGRPYMVMEHVDGEPVTRHVLRRRLDLAAILDLFARIAEAVADAHANLIIHRDLKPENILVTADGRIKLLDFGVAKILSGNPLEDSRTRATPLTPSHAAPEQLGGRPVTTATDVYALGVVLYEMLTGVSPWAGLAELPVSVAIHRRLESEPRPASEAARAAGRLRRARALEGDLDAILARALRVDPNLRYRTVEALLDDLRRHRQGFAVRARYGNRWYLFSRTLHRYRWALGATLVVVAVLAGFLVRFGLESERARRAEQQALREAETSREITNYLISLFETASPARSGGQHIEPKDLVDAGRQRLETHLQDRPGLRARMLSTLSQLYTELGYDADALDCAKDALAQADALTSAERAELMIRLGHAYDRAGRYAEAIETLRTAVAALGGDGERRNRLRAQWYLGAALINDARMDEGLGVLEAARDEARRHFAHDELHGDLLSALAVGRVLAGAADAAIDMQQQAMAIFAEHLPETHPKRIDAVATLGHIAYFAQRLELARMQFERAIALAKRVYDPNSTVILNMQRGLANTLSDQGYLREAIEMERHIIEVHRRVSGENPDLATSLINLATDLNRYGDYGGAEHAALQARQLLDEDSEPVEVLRADLTVAEALNRMGHTERALAMLDAEPAASRSGLLSDGFRALRHLYRCDALLDLSRLDEAEQELARAAELFSRTQPEGSRAMQNLRFRRGLLAVARGDAEQGLAMMQQAVDGILALGLDNPTYTLEIEAEIANALIDLGRRETAQAILERIAPAAEALLAPTSTVRLSIRRALRRLSATDEGQSSGP